MASYNWVPFYEEFAGKLLEYENNREELIEIIYNVFKEVAVNLPKMEKNHQIVDIDPFTVFSLFNQGFTNENIKEIISGFKKHMNIKADIPTSLAGLPTLTTVNSNFFDRKEHRGEKDIDHLWEFYKVAVEYSKNKTAKNEEKLMNYYNIVIKQRRMGTSKITMGLYWIAPYTFLSLHGTNRKYIYESGVLNDQQLEIIPKVTRYLKAEGYFKIKEIVDELFIKDPELPNNYLELSDAAWHYSQEVKGKPDDTIGGGLPDNENELPHYWIYSAGPGSNKWDEFYNEGVMAIGWSEFGDLSQYETRKEMTETIQKLRDSNTSFKNITLAVWDFSNKMKINDVIFVKEGTDKIVGWGIVQSDYYYDLKVRDDYKNRRKVDWKGKGEWDHPGKAVLKTLTEITSYTNYVEKLKNLVSDNTIEELEDYEEEGIVYDEYTSEDFLNEVYMSGREYENLKRLLENKKNIILQGPPGVGKTFMAKRLAYSMIGERNLERVKMVQFHQSYSYEDFIEGFRPSQDGDGFEIKKGAFHDFCREAEKDLENDYFFIIDEINRGNLSKIFGELLMLIENDKRGHQLQLLYSDDKFSVPKNVYLVGMMNTADRSLALLDYALRRRFAFYDLKPAFHSTGFKLYQNNLKSSAFNTLVQTIENLNQTIENDESLGSGFTIGHSYLSNLKEVNKEELNSIIEYEIIPLIREYWFDESNKVQEWEEQLRRITR